MTEQARPRSLAERLNRLFDQHARLHGRPLSNPEVADAIAATPNSAPISKTYLWQLRRGERTNPTLDHLEALARYFGVPVTYFLDDEAAERIDAQLELLAALRDNQVKGIALRAAGVPPDGLRAVANLLDSLRAAHGLPPAGDTTDDANP